MEGGGGFLPALSQMISSFANGKNIDGVKLTIGEFPTIFHGQAGKIFKIEFAVLLNKYEP